jgi:hypothetical protein
MSRFERLSLPLVKPDGGRLSLPLVKETGFGLNVEGSRDMLSLGLGLNAVLLSSTRIIPTRSYGVLGFFPELVLDFDEEKYFTKKRPSTFSDAITHTRASTATYVDSTGTLQTAAINEPRVGHHVWNGSAWVNEGLLHESEARTNSLPRNDFDGAVVGVIGSGGAAPTGAFLTNSLGSDAVTTVVETGTEFGMPYIDIRWQGTATANGQGGALFFNDVNTVSAATDQTWTSSVFYSLVDGISPAGVGFQFRFRIFGRSGATTVNDNIRNVSPPLATFSRVHGTATLSGASIDNVTTVFEFRVDAGAVVDITIRYYRPQLELGPTPSSVIPTSGSTVTRSADVLTIPAANLPYNSTALSIQMDGRVTYADNNGFETVRFVKWPDDSIDRLQLRLDTNGANTGRFFVQKVVGGVQFFVSESSSSYTPGILVPYNVAGRLTALTSSTARMTVWFLQSALT